MAVPALVLALVATHPLEAQESPKELRYASQKALTEGSFKEAIYPLSKLIEYLKASDEAAIVNELELVYYHLGLCHFLIGDFDGCRPVFDEYLTRYRRYPRAGEVMVFYGDSFRFQNRRDDAVKQYQESIRLYRYNREWMADIYASIAKCHLVDENWEQATPPLQEVYRLAPDPTRRAWAASLLTVSFLKSMNVENVFNIMPALLDPESFAGRSVVLNLAAMEAGDELFSDERYRDALWIYRIVYPKATLLENAQRHRERLVRHAALLKKRPDRLRELILAQESISEVEQEIEAIKQVEEYDVNLLYRIARSYMEVRRYHESYELFYHLYRNGAPDRREECLYLAFSSAVNILPPDKAFKTGHEYMDEYPGGTWYDTTSLTLGQLYARTQDWQAVITTLTGALEVSPQHEDVVECMYLIGYACFMEERFGESTDWLIRMNKNYPGNDREADGEYWCGMALMFDRKYEDAMPYFDRVRTLHPNSIYVEDARFRSATCSFGLSDWDAAEDKLKDFVASYPASKLNGEALVMLGDISGLYGRLPEAVDRYQAAAGFTLNSEQYNYSQFKCGEILDELGRHKEVIGHFTRYIEQKHEGSNYPLAIYWVGNAWWKLEERGKCLDYYLTAIERFGADRGELGVDLIIEEWIGKCRSLDPDTAYTYWNRLRDQMSRVMKEKKPALSMRLARALIYAPDQTEEGRENMMAIILHEQNLPHASADMLELILTEASQRGRKQLALRAAGLMVADFPETDSALPARELLAKDAMARQDTAEAIRQLGIIREAFATYEEAANALLTLGELYRSEGRFEEAHTAYNDVLGVRDWRRHWPAALYGRGMTCMEQGNHAEATAFFERIYVMYSAQTDWTAKAYLKRAEALGRIKEYRKALETLNEMMSMESLADEPATAEGRKLLTELRRRLS